MAADSIPPGVHQGTAFTTAIWHTDDDGETKTLAVLLGELVDAVAPGEGPSEVETLRALVTQLTADLGTANTKLTAVISESAATKTALAGAVTAANTLAQRVTATEGAATTLRSDFEALKAQVNTPA